MPKDLKLTIKEDSSGTWQDWAVESKDLVLIDDNDELTQKIKIRLQFIKGEWFLNTNTGVDYYGLIWKKNPDIAEIDRHIKAEVLSINGITAFIEYTSNLDRVNRIFTVSFRVTSIYGDIDINNLPLTEGI